MYVYTCAYVMMHKDTQLRAYKKMYNWIIIIETGGYAHKFDLMLSEIALVAMLQFGVNREKPTQ